MDGHLAYCADCRAELEDDRNLFAALADPQLHQRVLADPPPLPVNFTQQVMLRLAQEHEAALWQPWNWFKGHWTWGRWANAAYAFSAVLVVSAGSSEFLRLVALTYLNPTIARFSGIWADATVWLVQHKVASLQVLASLLQR